MTDQRPAIPPSLSDRILTVAPVLLLALTALRGRALLESALPLDSHGEAFFSWAYGNVATRRSLHDLEPALRFGEILWTVRSSDARYDSRWVTMMASYFWPHQAVLEVPSKARRRDRRIRIVEIGDSGVAQIRRATRPGDAVR